MIDGVGLNMTMLLTYLKEFVSAFNSGKIPQIQTALEHLLESECQSTHEKALKIFEEELLKFQEQNPDQQDEIQVQSFFAQLMDHTLNFYSKTSHVAERNAELYQKYKELLKKELFAQK